jgi:hypothetical protein
MSTENTMSEILLQQLIAYPTNAPSSNEIWSVYPQRRYELSEEEALYVTKVLTESMDKLAAILAEEVGYTSTAKVMKEVLIRPFLYAFDKGIEIVYKMRVDADASVEFNLQEMDDGAGDQIPEYMQLKAIPMIPIVVMIFHETIDFAEQDAASSMDIEDLFKSVLTGAVFLGLEFCLRQDLQDD